MSTRVSVVIPVYGPAPHLHEALRSVGPDADEIVVVDDGGPVPCAWVTELDSRVVYLRQDNAGVSAARNRGVLASTGDILFFLDQDDVFHPAKIATIVARIQEAGAAFAWSAFHIIDGDGDRRAEGWGRQVTYAQMLAGETGIQASALAVTRAAFSRTGLFDPGLRYAGDQKLALALLREEQGCFVASDLMGYRLHGGNESRKYRLVAAEMFSIWAGEAPHARSRDLRRARRSGLKALRTLFGWQAHAAVKEALATRDRKGLAKEIAWLLRHDPVGSWRRVVKRASQNVKGNS